MTRSQVTKTQIRTLPPEQPFIWRGRVYRLMPDTFPADPAYRLAKSGSRVDFFLEGQEVELPPQERDEE